MDVWGDDLVPRSQIKILQDDQDCFPEMTPFVKGHKKSPVFPLLDDFFVSHLEFAALCAEGGIRQSYEEFRLEAWRSQGIISVDLLLTPDRPLRIWETQGYQAGWRTGPWWDHFRAIHERLLKESELRKKVKQKQVEEIIRKQQEEQKALFEHYKMKLRKRNIIL